MYLDADDARTDVILAAVAAVLGPTAYRFVAGLPLYPRVGIVAAILDLAWIVAMTSLVPLLLARHRRDGAEAFGLVPGGSVRAPGAVALAVPGIAAGVLGLLVLVRGELPLLRLVAPVTVAGRASGLVLGLLEIAALSLGTVALVGFVAVRARDAFPRSPDVPLVQLVRTATLALLGVAVVGGVLRAIGGASLTQAGVQTAGLAAVLLLTDRLLVEPRTVPRAVVVAPLVVVTVAQVFARGGLFFGDLLGGLTAAALAGGVTLAIAVAATSRRGVATTIALGVAVHWWPTCLTPLAIAPTIC